MMNSFRLSDFEEQQAASPARATTVSGQAAPTAPAAPAAPRALPAIPDGGGRVIIDDDGDRKTITYSEMPPAVERMVQRVEETAFGLMGLLAVIILVGPFARLFARRSEKRHELNAVTPHAHMLQQQVVQLQQSIDAMSIEVERISEGQRFQSKLLHEKKAD